MADEIDAAQETEERHLAAALKLRQPEVGATGFCAYCNDRVNVQRVFCSADCSSDWHFEQKMRKISGR